MASEWGEVRLGDVCLVNPEKRDAAWPYDEVEYIDISSVATGSMNDPPLRMALSDAPSRAQRLVRAGDTIVSTVRPNRRSFLFLSDPSPQTAVSTGFAVLRSSKGIEPRFLYFLISTQQFTDYLEAHTEGSAYPAVAPRVFEDARVMLPSLSEQRAIARILGSLDDKIEANRRMNETLEAMARALFKSWFVDFDPVHAKAEGRDPCLPKLLADLFPASLEDSELGRIPKGWRIVSVSDVCSSISSGGTPSTQSPEYWGGGIPWLSSGETRNRHIITTEKTITPMGVSNSSTRLAKAGSTVIASAGQGHTRGQTSLLSLDSYVNQSVIVLTANRAIVSDFFLFFDLERRYEHFRQISDSSSSRGSLTTKLLGRLLILLPTPKLILEFDEIVGPLVSRIRSCLHQSLTLARLRDTMLPKLMTGEVRPPMPKDSAGPMS